MTSLDNWSTDAKLKLKVRLQDSQLMSEIGGRARVVSAHSRDDALECFSAEDALRLSSDRMSAAANT